MNGNRFGLTKVAAGVLTTTSGAYSAGDVIGGLIELPTLGRNGGRGSVIINVTVVARAAVTPTLDIFFYRSAPTAIADNAAFAMDTSSDILLCGQFQFTSSNWVNAGASVRIACDRGTGIQFDGTPLYAYIVDRTGVTLTSTSGMVLIVGTDEN